MTWDDALPDAEPLLLAREDTDALMLALCETEALLLALPETEPLRLALAEWEPLIDADSVLEVETPIDELPATAELCERL